MFVNFVQVRITGMADDEELRKEQKPSQISTDRAADIAESLFGVHVDRESVRELDSYDDRNFYVRGTLHGGAEQEEQRPGQVEHESQNQEYQHEEDDEGMRL